MVMTVGGASGAKAMVSAVGPEERSIDELFTLGVAGDDDAWSELVDRLSPAIWAVARNFGLSRDRAEDLAQTVWLRLIDRHDTIRDPNRLAGWVQTTARNEAISQQRRRDQRTTSVEDMHAEVAATGETPDQSVTTADTNRLLLAGMEQIDERCRLLLRLLAEKLPYQDIGGALDMRVGSIGPTKERCLEKLRRTPTVRGLLAGS